MTNINDFFINRFDKLENKLDEQTDEVREAVKNIGDELSIQSKLLSEYNQSLREHMRRTKNLEAKVDPLYTEYTEHKVEIKLKMKTWKKVAAFIGILGTVVALGVGIAQLVGVLK